MLRRLLFGVLVSAFVLSCSKDDNNQLRYYEVGIRDIPSDWRDSTFIIATSNAQLIAEVNTQLTLPIEQRKIINGGLSKGNGGYNKNGSHAFQWHFKEDDWHLTDFSIEIYDGRPYSDIDLNSDYWFETVKRFSPWGSYIKREVVVQ